MFNMYDWLCSEVGLEEGKRGRQNLFLKLVRLQALYGDVILHNVAEAWLRACELEDAKEIINSKAHFFCHTVVLKLKGLGLYNEKSRLADMSREEIIQRVFKRRHLGPLFPEDPAARVTHHNRCTNPDCPGCT